MCPSNGSVQSATMRHVASTSGSASPFVATVLTAAAGPQPVPITPAHTPPPAHVVTTSSLASPAAFATATPSGRTTMSRTLPALAAPLSSTSSSPSSDSDSDSRYEGGEVEDQAPHDSRGGVHSGSTWRSSFRIALPHYQPSSSPPPLQDSPAHVSSSWRASTAAPACLGGANFARDVTMDHKMCMCGSVFKVQAGHNHRSRAKAKVAAGEAPHDLVCVTSAHFDIPDDRELREHILAGYNRDARDRACFLLTGMCQTERSKSRRVSAGSSAAWQSPPATAAAAPVTAPMTSTSSRRREVSSASGGASSKDGGVRKH
jgi:hypothetical protein